LPIKILKKYSRKKSFLSKFFNKFARKFPYNMRIFSSDLSDSNSSKIALLGSWDPIDLSIEG